MVPFTAQPVLKSQFCNVAPPKQSRKHGKTLGKPLGNNRDWSNSLPNPSIRMILFYAVGCVMYPMNCVFFCVPYAAGILKHLAV